MDLARNDHRSTFDLTGLQLLVGVRRVVETELCRLRLLTPVRQRVQNWVDRRFNRSRYDAEKVVERFGSSLRDRIDTDGVGDGWMATVIETMNPTTAALWVRNRYGAGTAL